MTPEQFGELADRWLADVKAEALHLFRDGVPPEQCLKIAITINDAKAVGRMQRQAALATGLVVPRRN